MSIAQAAGLGENQAAYAPADSACDRVLAQHDGFTDEGLDFIINYDIKYRMGREG